MLTEKRRLAHNLANRKWRLSRPDYFPNWRAKHPGYIRPSMTATLRTWWSMQQRCNNPNAVQWRWYGAKGIKVKYRGITELIKDIGPRPSNKYSIDRIDPNKHYEQGNCRWLLKSENSRRVYASC